MEPCTEVVWKAWCRGDMYTEEVCAVLDLRLGPHAEVRVVANEFVRAAWQLRMLRLMCPREDWVEKSKRKKNKYTMPS